MLTTDRRILVLLGQMNLLVFQGWYWQLFTSIFVHVNLLHLLGNEFFLLIFGLKAEEIFSRKVYASVYLGTGLIGNLLTLLMGPYTLSAGASGAIFGLFGAATICLRRSYNQSIAGALIYSFYLFIMTLSAEVNILSHFGGLAGGLLFGYLLIKRTDRLSHIEN